MRRFRPLLAGLLLGAALATAASAAEAPPPSPPPPSPLEGELTPLGAIRAANGPRTIPAWTGGLTVPPKDYVPGQPHPDPFVDDTRWFTVQAQELDRFAIRLSGGLKALLRKYPNSFEIPVYLTRRTAALPQRVYDETIANSRRATPIENGLGVRDARVGIPFPIPKNGAQAMWNHVLRWRGDTLTRFDGIAVPDEHGNATVTMYREETLSPYAAGMGDAIGRYYRRVGVKPREVAGGTLLLHLSLDPLRRPFAGWYRPPGEPRVLRAPDYAYDTLDPATNGIRTADMRDMFSGMMDRFDFNLAGRREMYVPYNAYRLNGAGLVLPDLLWASHPNPAFLRYELHRVWVVEATLKRGLRHGLPRRVYYIDEDSWQIVMADHYNDAGELVRYAEAHGIQMSHVPAFLPTMEFTFDIPGGRYMASGIDNTEKPPQFDRPMKVEEFSAEYLLERVTKR